MPTHREMMEARVGGDKLFTIPPDLQVGDPIGALPLAGEFNWGMDALAIKNLRELSKDRGVMIGVIDTGIDETHPLFQGNLVNARDFTGSQYGPRDVHGHGTHTSGTAAGNDPRIGVASKAKLVHGKGLSDRGAGSGSQIVSAMQWCVTQGAEILSMSLGSDGRDDYITDAIAELEAQGVWIAAAAGNSGPGTSEVDWPARHPGAISVSAIDRNYQPASFTNAGGKIDTSAPGVDIISAKPNSGGKFQIMSGTSMATPWMAGFLSMLRATMRTNGLPPPKTADLRDLLARVGVDVGAKGRDRRTGPGFPSGILFRLGLVPDPPKVIADDVSA